jgi:hypothetical protein
MGPSTAMTSPPPKLMPISVTSSVGHLEENVAAAAVQ